MSEKMTVQQRFAKAWSSIENPELDSENDHFHNKYASLKATLASVRAACKGAGLVYQQRLTRLEDGYVLLSSVSDEDGEAMQLSNFPVETPPNPQIFGSGLTYTKRQQAQADWGITGEPDDDAEAASESRQAPRPKVPPKRKGASWAEFNSLKDAAIEQGVPEDEIRGYVLSMGVPTKDMTQEQIDKCSGFVRGLLK